jgi:hypothetical protein
MKAFDLIVHGNLLSIVTEGNSGSIESGLPRETCPSCGLADCVNDCDGAQGADENNDESEEDAVARQRYNAFVDAIESIALAHACAGVNISDPAYAAGLETALEAAGNNLLRRTTVELEEALVNLLAVIDKLPQGQITRALEKIDLSDDAWDESLQAVKDEVGWDEDAVSETEE